MKNDYKNNTKKENNLQVRRGNILVYLSSVLSLLLIIALVWTYGWHIPSLDGAIQRHYELLDPGRELLDSRNLIVDFQALRDKLTIYDEEHPGYLISIYFEYLPTGANISVNKDEEIWPASLIKIPVAMAAMKRIEEGKWKMSNELVIMDEDKDSEFGTLYQKPSGTTLTIENLFRETLVNSDNTAHFVFLRNLEAEEIKDLYIHLGFDDVIAALKRSPEQVTFDNRITAKRYSIFFRALYNATYLSSEYSEKLLEILASGGKKEYLEEALPENIAFAHKTGIRQNDGVVADSGIVYVPGRPYILTVMMQKKDKNLNEEEASRLMKEISQQVYDYVSTHN